MTTRAMIWIFVAAGAASACSGDEPPTALRLAIQFGAALPAVDTVRLSGQVDDSPRFAGEEFTVDPRYRGSSADLVMLFPDADGGRTVELEVLGLQKKAVAARASVSAVLRRGETVDAIAVLAVECLAASDTSCEKNTLVTCGPPATRKTCLMGCVALSSAKARCRGLVPSNLPSNVLNLGTGSFEPQASHVKIDTSAKTITGIAGTPVVRVVPQKLPGSPITVMAFKKINIPFGVKVTVTGANALALVASGAVLIEGVIDTSAVGGVPGPGGGRGGAKSTAAAGGGPGSKGQLLKGITSGGGGGSHFSPGGGGGQGASSTLVPGGKAGAIYGQLTLTPLTAGSGGGEGTYGQAAAPGGAGGGGGGAVQIVSAVSITIGSAQPFQKGGINVGGGQGFGCSGSCKSSSGGGGGSGGGALIEAPGVVIRSGSGVAANGGGGGGGRGADGKPGGLNNVAPAGGAGGLLGGGAGGKGGAVANLKGKSGKAGLAGGGGGGGGGIIRINTYTGKASYQKDSILSGKLSEGKVTTNP